MPSRFLTVFFFVAKLFLVNPLHEIAATVNLGYLAIEKLQIPSKFIVGSHLLGLGDIVIPGACISLFLKVHF